VVRADWLEQVRLQYEMAGLHDETAMVRDIAEILLVLNGLQLVGNLNDHGDDLLRALERMDPTHYQSPVPIGRRQIIASYLLEGLRRPLRGRGAAPGDLLDLYILGEFRVKRPDVLSTPPHVMKIMVDLVKPRRGDRIAIPRCGPGSLLIRAGQHAEAWGFEDTPDLARIAEINTTLHNLGARDRGESGCVVRSMWDFGSEWKPDIILAEAPARKGGSLTDGALVEQTLSALHPNGRAVVLVQQDFLGLSGGDKRDASLLRYLLEHGLNLVASLPVHSFRPYAGVSPTLLLIRKQQSGRVWFMRLAHDGYSPRGDRNFAKPPRGKDDLPLLAALLKADRKVRPVAETAGNGGVHGAVLRRYRVAGGAVLEPQAGYRIETVESLHQDIRTGFRAAVIDLYGQSAEWVGLLSDGTFEAATTREELFPGAVTARRTMNRSEGERLLIDRTGHILGVARSYSSLKEVLPLDLRPERYLSAYSLTGLAESPLQILQAIKRRHKEVAGRLDRLLGLLETPQDAASSQGMPAVPYAPFAVLSPQQLTLWRVVEARKGATGVPEHFDASQVAKDADMESSTATATLELFCRLGLIRAVTVNGIPCYRLLIPKDIPQSPPTGGQR